jgi:hypothetical protein
VTSSKAANTISGILGTNRGAWWSSLLAKKSSQPRLQVSISRANLSDTAASGISIFISSIAIYHPVQYKMNISGNTTITEFIQQKNLPFWRRVLRAEKLLLSLMWEGVRGESGLTLRSRILTHSLAGSREKLVLIAQLFLGYREPGI